MLEKTAVRFFFCVADVFVSAAFAAKVSQTFVHVVVAISSPEKNPDTFHDVCLIQIASFSIVQCLWDTFFDVKPNTINLLSSCQTHTIGLSNFLCKLAFVV